MASGPITSWQMDGETVETMTGFIFWALKSLQLWNYKMFAHWKKSYDRPRQHIKKQSHYFANKFHLVKAMFVCLFFPVVIYGCKSWSIKKAECQRIDDFELWWWTRLLKVPWTSRKYNLKEISPEYSLGGLMLKQKLQYFGHLMQRLIDLKRPWN